MSGGINITFGIIVLNGEPFTKYCLRALYPHAHEIIVVEGACEGSRTVASPEGHSVDGTLEILRKFKQEEDPENKLVLVTAESEGFPDGFWPGEKDMMSQAYASRATGNYLWQVDIDEFYTDETIVQVKKILAGAPSLSTMTFRQKQFWGGFEYLVDSWLLRRGARDFHRLFKWGEGYKYVTHRPPTVAGPDGQNLRCKKWLTGEYTSKLGLFLMHYSFVFPKQVYEKARYYKNAEWSKREKADWWYNEVYLKLSDPFSVFSIYWDKSWLKRYRGSHPVRINEMINDIRAGNIKIEMRHTEDINALLNDWRYRLNVKWLIIANPLNDIFTRYRKSFLRKVKSIFHESAAS